MTEKKTDSLPTLTSRQKKYLKGLAHELSPVIQIGKEGISDKLLEATDVELLRHELIKVKIGNNSGLEKQATGNTLSETTTSALVQVIGKTILLYRPNPKMDKEKRIRLPRG